MGRRPHIRFRVRQNDLRIVDGAIKSLRLEKLAMRHIDKMSGGELYKGAMGRAMVQEPSLLLLDEPTSSLDLKNQVKILKLIRHVVSEHQVCTVMTLHDLTTALRFADKCLFLKKRRHLRCSSPPGRHSGYHQMRYTTSPWKSITTTGFHGSFRNNRRKFNEYRKYSDVNQTKH